MHGIPVDAFHLYPGDSVDSALTHYLDSHQGHQVIVDQALSHGEVVHQAALASDASLGGPTLIDAHFPWITAATVGQREIRLLANDRTDMTSAVKNVSLDIGMRGGGAVIGAKGGALIGGLLGPVGAAVGGVIGAIGGAIFGSGKANEIKQRPLMRAIETLKKMERDYGIAAKRARNEAEETYRSERFLEGERLKRLAQDAKASVENELESLRRWRVSAGGVNPAVARAAIRSALEELSRLMETLDQRLQSRSFFRRHIWPSEMVLALELARQWCHRACDELSAVLQSVDEDTAQLGRAEVYATLSRWGVAKNHVMADLRVLEDERRGREETARARIDQAYAALAAGRADAIRRLEALVRQLLRAVREKLEPLTTSFAEQARTISGEAAKLGR